MGLRRGSRGAGTIPRIASTAWPMAGLTLRRLDVALLMKRQGDGVVVPFVFLARGARYQVTEIEGITDPDGFAQDASVWPGPFCIPKPPSGAFKSWVGGDHVNVVGDLFSIGWKTYFWNPAARRFDGILTTD